MKKIAMVNKKGGVGKTTGAINLAERLARKTKGNILIVDLDPQCNLTTYARGVDSDHGLTIVDVMKNYPTMRLGSVVETTFTPDVYIIPSHPSLEKYWPIFQSEQPHYMKMLSRLLADFENDFEYVIFDFPPSFNCLAESAIACCDAILIPVGQDQCSAAGLAHLWIDIAKILDVPQDDIPLPVAVFFSAVDTRENSYKEAKAELERAELSWFKPELNIRRAEVARLAGWHNKTVKEYAPSAPVLNDYTRLANYVMETVK